MPTPLKQFTITFKFDKNLIKKSSAYGICYPIVEDSDNIIIKIDSTCPQPDLINTMYHEFTHFISNLLFDSDNFEKYFYQINRKKKAIITSHKKHTITQEEALCRKVANACQKAIMQYVKK